jgi:hypothetical protein
MNFTSAVDSTPSTSLNGFTVSIIAKGAKTLRKFGYKYVGLKHGTEFGIELKNNSDTRCDAQIIVDGRSAGTFRLEPYGRTFVERPVHADRKFTFLREESRDARVAGVDPHEDNGIVKVIFTPELHDDYTYESPYVPLPIIRASKTAESIKSATFNSFEYDGERKSYGLGSAMSAGATVLGKQSEQKFRYVDRLASIDDDRITTLHMRLVVDETKPDYPYTAWRTFPINSNEIPPSVSEVSKRTKWLNDGWL